MGTRSLRRMVPGSCGSHRAPQRCRATNGCPPGLLKIDRSPTKIFRSARPRHHPASRTGARIYQRELQLPLRRETWPEDSAAQSIPCCSALVDALKHDSDYPFRLSERRRLDLPPAGVPHCGRRTEYPRDAIAPRFALRWTGNRLAFSPRGKPQADTDDDPEQTPRQTCGGTCGCRHSQRPRLRT